MPEKSRPFVHLHCHSHYSLLDGASEIGTLVKRAKEHGMNGLALTDHGNLHGALEFYQKAKEAGINPILGYEAYIAPGSRFEKKDAAQQQGGQLSPDAAGPEPHGLSEPGQAGVGRLAGRLLLQAADRQGAAGGPQRGADLPVAAASRAS